MPQFVGVHEGMTSSTDDEVKKSWADYKAACQKRGCQAVHVHYSTKEGRGFCLTEANSADDVRQAHTEANVPVKEVVEVTTIE